jgi:hypothetical protein
MKYLPGKSLRRLINHVRGEHRTIGRRDFFIGSGEAFLGLLALGGLGYGGHLLLRDTEANRRLADFPDKILGAREVRKYRTPEAQHTLVHVLQVHQIDPKRVREAFPQHSEDYLKKVIKKENKAIREIQDDIYQILSDLVDEISLGEVYVEAVTGENLREMNSLEILRSNIQNYNRLRSKLELIKNPIDRARLEKEVKTYGEKFVYNWEGALRLAAEDKIDIRAAESKKTNETSSRERMTSLINPSVAVLDDREDYLLEKVVADNNVLAVTVFGAGHAWGGVNSFGPEYPLGTRKSYRDNIAVWNKENPQQKFSLIEVVPSSYTPR